MLWEILLLERVGFGLQLYQCAISGQKNNLVYISPKTGNAVSLEYAGEYNGEATYSVTLESAGSVTFSAA